MIMKKELNTLEVKVPDGQTETFYFEDQPYTGMVYWESNGLVLSEFEVKNGVKDGMEKEFVAGHRLASAINYKEGQEEGMAKYFYESGKLKDEIYFEMGEIIWSNAYNEKEMLANRYEIDKNSSSYKRLQYYKAARAKRLAEQ